MKTIEDTAIIILAAGMSRRMGADNKLLLTVPSQQQPMVHSVTEQAVSSNASKVYVVVGHQSDDVKSCLKEFPVTFIDNKNYQEGLSASIKAAVDQIADCHHSFIIALADMPFINNQLFNLLIDRFNAQGSKFITAPVYNLKRGNPVLWPQQYFKELSKIKGDKGGKHLIEQHRENLLLVDVKDQSVCLDIDNHEQLRESYPEI